MREYDVIVIGAGVAGLVAGNYLIDKGRRVLIVEQGKHPGGCACSFGRQGFRFDAAVHWISQAGEGGIVKQVLSDFGLANAVKFDRLPAPPAVWLDGVKVEPGFGMDAVVGAYSNAFPAEAAAIRKFWEDVQEAKGQLWRLVKSEPGKMTIFGKLAFNLTFPLKFKSIARYHKKKASEVIRERFRDERLRRALESHGIFPDISFVHYSWFNMVTLDGDAFYPEGGIQAVPDALARRFTEKGGEIRYRTKAEKIIIENKKAAGVVMMNGEEVRAARVISAGDAKNTFLNMVGRENLPKGFAESVDSWKASESFFYVYLGVDLDLKAMGFDGRPVWYFPREMKKTEFPMLGGEAVGIGMPSALDPSLAPEGKGVVILGMVASCTHMAQCPVMKKGEAGKEAYKAVKERIGEYLIDVAGEAIPGLRDRIEVKVVASPHTFERYTMNCLGASSGWSMAADAQHKLPIRTPIPGLYLAGHWTMNPGGVPAAFVSGKMVVEEVG